MNVVMLLANAYRPDIRVEREANSLASAGYRVNVICWDRTLELPSRERIGDVEIYRVQNVPTRYGAGPRQIIKIPRFWSEALRLALDLQPDVVHCHDLDTLYAGWQIKGRLGCHLIYDAHEDYPALMSLYLPGFMVFMLRMFERKLIYRTDAIFTASTVYAQKLMAKGLSNVTALPNVNDIAPFDAVSSESVRERREQLHLKDSDIAVAYIGGLTRNRELLPFIQAAGVLPEMRFFLWGDGHQKESVINAVHGKANIQYMGWLPADLIPVTIKAMDAIYYCLREDYPGAQFNAPNTLSHTMAAGRPIIANKVGDLGRVVNSAACGVLLDTVTPDTIYNALLLLQNHQLRQQMGAAGYKYAKEKYNWRSISAQLLHVYAGFPGNKK